MTDLEKRWLTIAHIAAIVLFALVWLAGCGLSVHAEWKHPPPDSAVSTVSIQYTGEAANNITEQKQEPTIHKYYPSMRTYP